MILKHFLIIAYCIWQVWEDSVKTWMEKHIDLGIYNLRLKPNILIWY